MSIDGKGKILKYKYFWTSKKIYNYFWTSKKFTTDNLLAIRVVFIFLWTTDFNEKKNKLKI